MMNVNNMEIIANEAVASGFFKKEEVEELLENGEDIPFHTYAIWKAAGFVPRAGVHGWECRLWRKKNKAKEETEEEKASEEERKRDFYLTKSFLFHVSQVKRIEE